MSLVFVTGLGVGTIVPPVAALSSWTAIGGGRQQGGSLSVSSRSRDARTLWRLVNVGLGCNARVLTPRQHGTRCMVLPTGNPVQEGQASDSHPHRKWSARAIKSFSMSELEARKLKYPTTGTEALLMGILTEGTSQASRYLRANGVTLFGVRDQTIKVLGKADMYFFSPEHPPLTEQAQMALDWAIAERDKRGGDEEVTATLILLGIWAQKGSAGQKVLEDLDFNDQKAEELLAPSTSSYD